MVLAHPHDADDCMSKKKKDSKKGKKRQSKLQTTKVTFVRPVGSAKTVRGPPRAPTIQDIDALGSFARWWSTKSARSGPLFCLINLGHTTILSVILCPFLSLHAALLLTPPPPSLRLHILVIFGRRALIFFCLKALGKNEK